MLHVYDSVGTKQKLTQLLNGDKVDIWKFSKKKESVRLAQGNKYGVKATDTMDFINKKELPEKFIINYARFFCNHCRLKT